MSNNVKQCKKSVRQLHNYFDTSIFILYMLNNVKQCQTMSEKCQTVTEQSYIYNYIYNV